MILLVGDELYQGEKLTQDTIDRILPPKQDPNDYLLFAPQTAWQTWRNASQQVGGSAVPEPYTAVVAIGGLITLFARKLGKRRV